MTSKNQGEIAEKLYILEGCKNTNQQVGKESNSCRLNSPSSPSVYNKLMFRTVFIFFLKIKEKPLLTAV